MKQLRNIAGLSGLALLAWSYQAYRRDKVAVIQNLREGSQVMTLDVGQVEYAIEGEGQTMLIAHGGMGGYEQGLMTGRMLNYDANFQLIAPSRAGARRSDISTGRTFAEQATTYRKLLDKLNIDKAVIVGLSGGGISALQFALDYPERCAALVLVSATSPIIAQIYRPQGFLFLMDVMMSSDYLIWLMQKTIMKPLLRTMGESSGVSDNNEAMISIMSHFFPSSEWRENIMTDMRQILNMKDYPFEDITVPTLLLHGTSDPVVAPAVAETTAQRIPNAELILIENGLHLMIGTDTAILHQHLKRFLMNAAS